METSDSASSSCDSWDNAAFTEAWAHLATKAKHSERSRRQQLSEVIENTILPQLRIAHANDARLSGTASLPGIGERVGEFADLVIMQNSDRAVAYFEALLGAGVSIGYLFRELIGPAAIRLGELWNEDINTMFDVTQGLANLQHIVRRFGVDYRDAAGRPILGRCALLMPIQGEQHLLGVTLVEEYFRREGWQVWGGSLSSTKEVLALVRTMWFDMVGFSASRVVDPKKFARELRAIRKVSANKNIVIMVGGQAFIEHPELVELVGADSTAADGQHATQIAAQMVSQSEGKQIGSSNWR